MKFQKLTTISLLLLSFLATSGTASQKPELESAYDKAFRAFDSGKYDEVLATLDTIDALKPDLAESLNLRGVVYMRQGRYDEAEKILRKALSIEPKFWNASFNLAEIPFLKKDWTEARDRFEALTAGEHDELRPETSQLIDYKILLTFVLQGKENMVDWILNKFEFSKDSPALYYSNAGIAFQHGNQKQAKEWMSAADKHFPERLNKLYAESFYEIGWLQRPAGEARPAIEITSPAEHTQGQPGPARIVAEQSVAAGVSPAVVTAALAAATQTPAASPATARFAPAQSRVSPPSLAATFDRFPRTSAWLVGGLLLTGLLLLVWLVMQQVRRTLATVPVYQTSSRLAALHLFDEEASPGDKRKAAPELLGTGLPKLPHDLEASESAGMAGVVPGRAGSDCGATQGVVEPLAVSPNGIKTPQPIPAPVANESNPAGSDGLPARDREDVFLSAAVETVADGEAAFEKPAVEKPDAAVPPFEGGEILLDPAFVEPGGEENDVPKSAEATSTPGADAVREPIGQGQPVPELISELTTAFVAEPVIPELTQPGSGSPLELIEPEGEMGVPIAVHRPVHSATTTPSFAPKVIASERIRLQPTAPTTTAETAVTPPSASGDCAPASAASVQQFEDGMHAAVQLTFSLEIASMQLAPTLKMSDLALQPTSKVVSMRFAPSQDPQPPMKLPVTFEVVAIELAGNTIGTVRLSPSSQPKPTVFSLPSFSISGLELVAGSAPVQLIPSHQERASVQLTAEFQIAAIEFTPVFEMASIVLNSTSRNVSMRLPGSEPNAIKNSALFEIENVQLGLGNELGLVRVTSVVREIVA